MLRSILPVLGGFGVAVGAVTASQGGPNSFLQTAEAASKELIGEFGASGLIFKDKVVVQAYQDPKVEGVTVYISSVKDGRLKAKYWFNDPSATSLTVAQTGPIKFLTKIDTSLSGEDVFTESRSLFFKTVHVRRVYDDSNNCLVYVAYSTRLTSNESEKGTDAYKTSLAAVPLGTVLPPDGK